MPRGRPSTPPAGDVREAAEQALDRRVVGVTSIEEGLDAVCRVDLPDGDRAVLDVASHVGDGRFDLALAEDALVEVPLGGTDEADRLRTALRHSHAEARGLAPETVADDRYPYYQLYARARRLRAFGYWAQFAREDDPDTVARRWRSVVDDLVACLE